MCICGVIATALSGCKKEVPVVETEPAGPSYDEIVAKNNDLISENMKLSDELLNVRQVLGQYAPDLVDADLNYLTTLDTGVEAYTAADGKIRIDDELILDGDIETRPNLIKFYVSDDISFKPGTDWTVNTRNNAVQMLHKDGMHVTVESYKYYRDYLFPSDLLELYVTPYMEKMHFRDIKTTKIFNASSGSVSGYLSSATMTVKAYDDGSKKYEKPDWDIEYLVDENGQQILDQYGLPQQLAVDDFGHPVYDEEGNRVIIENEAPVVPEPEYLRDEDGNLIWQTDEEGYIIPATDENGNIIYQTDEAGNTLYLLDEEGNQVLQMNEETGQEEPIPLIQGIPIEIEPEPEPVVADYKIEEYVYTFVMLYDPDNANLLTIKAYWLKDGSTENIKMTFFKDNIVGGLNMNGLTFTLQ